MSFTELLEWAKPQIAAILPKHLTPERMVALATLAATKTPKLKECTPLTLFNAIVNASKLGLEIGTQAHLVPFRNSKANATECVMIPDYRGLISLAIRSGHVRHIDARAVYTGDEFDYQLGTDPKIVHKPKFDAPHVQQNIIAFYAVAHLDDDAVGFEVMSKAEVDAIRGRSRASQDGPWVTDYEAMGKKTVVKRLAKFLPQTPQMAAAVELDNRAETGEISTVSDIIDSSDSINQAVAQSTKERAEALKEKLGGQSSDGGTVDPGMGAGDQPAAPVASPAAGSEQGSVAKKGPVKPAF
jgi:recombination protein RecT